MFKTIHIAEGQRGLRFRDGNFVELLLPGRHLVREPLFSRRREKVELFDLLDTRFEHARLDLLVGNPQLRTALEVIDLRDHERAIVKKDGRVAWVLGPGRHAFWNQPYELEVQRYDAREGRLRVEDPDPILAADRYPGRLAVREVPPAHELLVYRDGELIDRVRSGRYVYWVDAGRIDFHLVDLREQVLDVAGQEIMTRDKVTLRVNLVVTYRIDDPVASVTVVGDAAQALYREAQLALRSAVGTRPIDELLADKESVGAGLTEAMRRRAAEFGVVIRAVGLRDIVLPGDMKEILNRVITAEKESEANLIRRREETAAARSQANTARLLAQNPVLTRMKELELLGEVLAGTKATFVLGRGDVFGQIRGLLGADEATERA